MRIRNTMRLLVLGGILLLAHSNKQQEDAAISCIKTLCGINKVKNLVIFDNDHLKDTKRIKANDFLKRLFKEHKTYLSYISIAIDNFSNDIKMTLLESFKLNYILKSDENLVIIFATNTKDKIIDIAIEALTLRRHIYTLFIMADDVNMKETKLFFNYLWQKQLRFSLLIMSNSHFYTMNPYPKLKVLNVTNRTANTIFPHRNVQNMLGYKVRVPVQNDIPLTFLHRRNGKIQLSGIGGKLFREFMHNLNVDLSIYLLTNVIEQLNSTKMTEFILNNQIEISPHLTKHKDAHKDISYSYPFILTRRCLILPLHNEISQNFVILLPFKWRVWLTICILLVVLVLYQRLVLFVNTKFLDGHEELLFDCSSLMMALTFLFNLPPPRTRGRSLKNLHWCTKYSVLAAKLLTMWCGFIISQIYSTTLTSMLAVKLYSKPMATIESVISSEIPILVDESHMNSILASVNGSIRLRLQNLMHLTNIDEFIACRSELNQSYIYPLSEQRWHFLEKQNFYFWYSNVCFGVFPLQYQMRKDSHFFKPLMYFTLHVFEHGFMEHWRNEALMYITLRNAYNQSHLQNSKEVHADYRPINFESFEAMCQILGYVYILSCIIFASEILLLKLKNIYN